MGDVGVLEGPHHMRDCVHAANMREELVPQSLAFARALDQSRDVDELHRGGNDLLRLLQINQLLDARIRHRHDARIRLDGAERKILCRRLAIRQRIEQRGLADIRESYKTTGKSHLRLNEK